MGADAVGDLEGVQRRIGGEDAAVVGGEVQAGVAFVDGAEQAEKEGQAGKRHLTQVS